MADIQKLTYPYFTDGTTQLNAANLNPIIAKLNEVIDQVNSGVSPTPTQTVATPTISISGTTATISCSTSGAIIYYTLNGNTPTTSSTQYTGAITLSGACTIKAIAVKSGMNNSSVASQSYTPSVVATPVISISGNSATITCATSGAQIRYTLDGTTPTANSTLYSSAITLSQSCTIKAIAIKSGMTNSSVASQTYTPAVLSIPTISFNTTSNAVALSASSGLTIKYSTDGSTPSSNYTSPFTIADGAIVKAVSTNGTQSSDVPKITIEYDSNGDTLVFSTNESGTIRYTSNGSDPVANSTAISYGITLESGKTYKAAIFNDGIIASEILTINMQ